MATCEPTQSTQNAATAQPQDYGSSQSCYVFIDNSNVWITGQKVRGKRLKDVPADNRFRVDLGRLLNLMVRGRPVRKAYLYGSVPPQSDTVWEAARERHFEVRTFQRSDRGREKEVNSAMSQDMVNALHEKDKGAKVFITVTGDRNHRPPILNALEKGVSVELWSWEDAMAREFCQLANQHPEFRAQTLDSVQNLFGYTAYMSNHNKKKVNPAHAIVYRDVPGDEMFLRALANHMDRLSRLYYITSVESQTAGEKDYIIEFPYSSPEVVLEKIRKLGYFEYQPCSYPEYSHHSNFPTSIEIYQEQLPKHNAQAPEEKRLDTSRELDECDSDDDSEDFNKWDIIGRKNPPKTKKMRCPWKDHCDKAAQCPNIHTDEEKERFARFPRICFQYFKSQECRKKHQHVTALQRKSCAFAHVAEDSWCLACKMYGHLTNDCQVTK